jgi:hypothetical protein
MVGPVSDYDDDSDDGGTTPPRYSRAAMTLSINRDRRVDESGKTPVFDDPDTPATKGEIAQLLRYVKSRLDDSDAGARQQAEQFSQIMMTPTEIVELRGVVRDMHRLRNWVLGGALSALLVLGAFMFSRGFGEGRDANRIDVLERSRSELERTLQELQRELYRRSDSRHMGPDAVSSGTPSQNHDQN